MREPRQTVPLPWLTHWITCVALVVLLVNDHVLKARLGTWWTGKLSDVAWLVVTPPLVAVVLAVLARGWGVRRPSDRAVMAVVASVFVVVKTTALGAASASAVLTALAGPSVVLADPTDLLAVPALVLAWLAARGAWAGIWARAPWLVVLPVAVLATAATSVGEEQRGATQIAVVHDQLIVGDGWQDQPPAAWYVSSDGSAWDVVHHYGDGAATKLSIDRAYERARGTDEVCAPEAPHECYRAVRHGLGVERSDDAGGTWTSDWGVPDDQVRELADRYEPPVGPIETFGVALVPTATGYRVYAANGGDGLAVRDEHGTWTRTGLSFQDHAPAVVPLPGEPTTIDYPVSWGAILAAPAVLLTLVVAGLVRPRGPRRRRTVAAAILAPVALVASGIAAMLNLRLGVVDGQTIGSKWIFGALLPGGLVLGLVVLALGGAIAVVVLQRRGVQAAVVIATGVVAAVCAAALPWPVLGPAVGVGVVLVGATGCRALARRQSLDEPASAQH